MYFYTLVNFTIKRSEEDSLGLPDDSVVKNLTADVVGTGSIPSPGIPHAIQQPSPCATTIKPVLKSPGAANTEASAP